MDSSCEIKFESASGRDSLLKPIGSGEEICSPGHFWGAGVRAHYVVHYIISGTGVFYCGANKYTLRKGDLFVIFPGTVVKYQADVKDPWHYAWAVFNGSEAATVFEHLGLSVRNPVMTVAEGKKLTELLRAMPEERGGSLSENLKFSSLLYEMMSLLVKDSSGEEKSENVYLIAATRYVRAHYPEDLTVEKIASHIGISRKYLFAIFKNSLGVSPKEYIVDYRMKKACEFLKDSNLSVGNVAYSVGYKDSLTFSRMFKTKMGRSPTEYRNE